jgi:VWFA-related protein
VLPHPISGRSSGDCPPISFYQADQIVNKHDPEALQTAVNDYIVCANLPPQMISSAGQVVLSMASGVLSTGEHESRIALGVIQDTIRRIMAMPGQRNIVLISPGFLTPDLEYEYYDIVDRALRAQAVINSLDARGLYAPVPGGDASSAGEVDHLVPGQQNSATLHVLLDMRADSVQQEVLSALAYGTGGNFFHNNNDMDEGLRRLAEPPEYSYILGFTPQNLKPDGKFHTLKVRLKPDLKYDLQARRGYYAPKKAEDPAEQAKREIDDEVLSSEELHDLPVALHTQFFKANDDSAKLTVLARIDVKRLHYKQADNRNQNDLTVVTAVFDRNGNMLQANQKLLQMRWKNETLQGKLAAGITLKSSFDVKPGRYMVRVVARDTQQQLMSAENGAVEIP